MEAHGGPGQVFPPPRTGPLHSAVCSAYLNTFMHVMRWRWNVNNGRGGASTRTLALSGGCLASVGADLVVPSAQPLSPLLRMQSPVYSHGTRPTTWMASTAATTSGGGVRRHTTGPHGGSTSAWCDPAREGAYLCQSLLPATIHPGRWPDVERRGRARAGTTAS